MGKFASSLCAALLLSCCAAFGQASVGQCGYDRWPVKVMVDEDRDKVAQKPLPTSITELRKLTIHEIPYPYKNRIDPEELETFTIKARIVAVLLESDSDLHVIVAEPDDSKSTMIVEIPAPECAKGSGLEKEFEVSRRVVHSFTTGTVVEITGVGFWDFQ